MTPIPTDAERFGRVIEIFEAVCDLPPNEVDARLADLCGSDADLSSQVRVLLVADREGEGRLEALTARGAPQGPAPGSTTPEASLTGTRIAQFEVGGRIGRGGMGEVYVGVDTVLRRQVALKAIRHDQRMSDSARRRFLHEARMLSSLDHPNICRIHDYVRGEEVDVLVLELIRGRSLRSAVADGLSRSQALAIAEQIGDALAAAHAEGIVHQDLKLSNVMLTAEGTVKILDFGLARPVKVGDGGAAEAETSVGEAGRSAFGGAAIGTSTLFRNTRRLLAGTPSAMSPEQLEGQSATAASDMYSFGLLAQELFTGQPAYDPQLDLEGLLEAVRAGTTRRVTGLDRDLAGLIQDLKARRPRARPTASQAVERLRRVRGKPRRRLFTAAAIVIVALVALAGGKYTLDLKRERTAADHRRAEAEELTEFLVGLFELSDPSEAKGSTITAREILDQGADRIEAELADQPETQARLMTTIGRVNYSLGLYEAARELLERAVAIRERQLGPEHPDVAESLHRLGLANYQLGSYADAESLHRRALAIRERTLGLEHLDVAVIRNDLALVYWRTSRLAEAKELFASALAIREQWLGPEHVDMAESVNNLALISFRLGQYSETEELLKRAVAIRERVLGAHHPSLVTTISNLANTYHALGRYSDAEVQFRRSLAIGEETLDPEHPKLAFSLNGLGVVCWRLGRHSEAAGLLERALSIWEGALGPEHAEVGTSLTNLALVYTDLRRYPEAEALFERAVAVRTEALGPEHPFVAHSLHRFGRLRVHEGRHAEAERLYRRSLEIREKVQGSRHPELAELLRDYAALLRDTARPAEARALEERAAAVEPAS